MVRDAPGLHLVRTSNLEVRKAPLIRNLLLITFLIIDALLNLQASNKKSVHLSKSSIKKKKVIVFTFLVIMRDRQFSRIRSLAQNPRETTLHFPIFCEI
jgi:hypothetical protein